jgi:hypothetical protein
MTYIHVRNLEKYHPGYKDRKLLWAKIYFDVVQGDTDLELIRDEIAKWRYVAMICLELQARKPLPGPTDVRYWRSKGFDLKKQSMSLTLQILQTQVELVTDSVTEDQKDVYGSPCIEEREKEKEKESKTAVTRRIPPDPKDVWEYAKTIGLTQQDCRRWWDHHETRGWKLNRGVPMKDWRAALRTWKGNKARWAREDRRSFASENAEAPKMYTCSLCGAKMPLNRQFDHHCPTPVLPTVPEEVDAELAKLKKDLKG